MFFTIAAVVLLGFLYLFNQHKHRFWINRGFVQLEPKIFVGDFGPMLTMKMSIGEFFYNIYVKHKQHKALGVYIQHVMVRDFSSFHDRPVPFDLEHDTLQNHLFNVGGQKWRDLRVKVH